MLVQAVGGRIAARTRKARIRQSKGGDAERGQKDKDTGGKAMHDVPVMLLGVSIALQPLPSCLQPLVALYPCP